MKFGINLKNQIKEILRQTRKLDSYKKWSYMLLLDNNVHINSNVPLYRTLCMPMLASITSIVQYAHHIHHVMLHTFLMFLGNITINLIPNVFALLKLFSALV